VVNNFLNILKQLIPYILIVSFLCACKQEKKEQKALYPSDDYEYSSIDTSRLLHRKMFYVPIYSHIYMSSGNRTQQMTATLSIRSINFSDSLYVTNVDYYSSQGKLIKRYLSKTLLLKPMHSIEFVVEESESEGGAGANFIVEYGSVNPVSSPLLQAVMTSTANSSGVSFTTEGLEVR
jgi:hypothetical protein